ncbi:MAG: hypothetical protein LBR65_03870 [Culturomica sp.]|jgi:hypothetical protein|nr:hypothetical protein [Culturomica sp.]
MRFTEIAAGDDLTRKMAQEVVKKSPLLASYIEFFKKPGNSVSVRAGGTVDGVVGQTRALGGKYAEKTVAPTYATGQRKMLGDTVRIDVAYERMGYDLSSELTAQLTRRVREVGYAFNYMLIKGNPAAEGHDTEFTGLAKLIDSKRVVTAATNGLALLLGNSDTAKKAQQTFLEKLDETIALCQGTNKVIITNARVLARLNAVAREYLTISKNEFGVPITHYNHVPLIDAGDYLSAKDTFSPVIGFNETVGTATTCGSLYVASFEEEDGLSFATCDGGFTVYPVQQTGNWLECMFELIADSMLVRSSALSKLEGLKME